MSFILDVLGPQAFSKWRVEAEGMKKMSNFNAAVFDALAVGIATKYSISILAKEKKKIVKKLVDFKAEMFSDQSFFDAISGSVNDVSKVTIRINLVHEFLSK
jgi:hypothetical protein